MFMRIVAPVMFFSANFLILCVVCAFLFVLMPPMIEDSVVWYLTNTVYGLWIVVNLLFNYFACCFTAPGFPVYCFDPLRELGGKNCIVDGRNTLELRQKVLVVPGVSYRFCKICHCIKPPRTHHCRYDTLHCCMHTALLSMQIACSHVATKLIYD